MSPLDSNLISPHLAQGNSSCQQGQSSPETPTQVAFCWMWFLNARMSLILCDMIPTCFCVLWLSQHFFSQLQILRCKMRRHESSGSLPCHDFLFSLGEINGTRCNPTEAVFISALLFSISLYCCAKKPREDRLHTSKTLFSAPQWFCTFWKGPHYCSAGDFKHFHNSFWCSWMHSHAQHWVCLYNQSPANPHDYRNSTLAHALSPWQSDTDFFPLHQFFSYNMIWIGVSVFCF